VRQGFATVNLTDDELAKEHVRHMVGGRSALARTSGCSASSSPSGPAR
jgi:threonine dehydratase